MSDDKDAAFARAGRRIALLIAGAGLLAMLAPWLVQKLGLAPRFEIAIYLVAMACFVFAMVNLAAMWRRK